MNGYKASKSKFGMMISYVHGIGIHIRGSKKVRNMMYVSQEDQECYLDTEEDMQHVR